MKATEKNRCIDYVSFSIGETSIYYAWNSASKRINVALNIQGIPHIDNLQSCETYEEAVEVIKNLTPKDAERDTNKIMNWERNSPLTEDDLF